MRATLPCAIAMPILLAAHAASAQDMVYSGPVTELHVAPDGDGGASGAEDAPLATIEGARDRIRAVRAQGTVGPAVVRIHAGVYKLERPIVFEHQDGGTANAPVAYSAQPGESVTVRGSRTVTGWERWRGEIWRADLGAQGLEGVRFHQLFWRGQRQPLARHPNADPEHPRTGGFVLVEDQGPRPYESFIYADGDLPFGEWDDISQAEVWTVFGLGWNFAIAPTTDVDREHRIISTRRVRRQYERMNRYFVQNVLGALDAPGEWFLDYATSRLYFWPPEGEPAEVRVPVLDYLIEVRGSIPWPHEYLHTAHTDVPAPRADDVAGGEPVENLQFMGMRLEEARQDGFRLTGANRCGIIACSVTNVGGVGINLGGVASAHEEVGNPRVTPAEGLSGGVGGGGQNLLFNDPCVDCTVEGCDVWGTGSDGIFLYGGGNTAMNNHVFDTGLFDKDCACINLWGDGNVAMRNELHDVPRNAVFLKGNGNLVMHNDIHHTMLETCDGGAIRMCQRNLNLRGNGIIENRIFDTVGYGYPRTSRSFESPYYSWGVYLDDFTCGTRVAGNLIVRTGRGGVMIHGGSDNTVEGNIIVDAGDYQVEHAPIREPVAGNVIARNILVCDGEQRFVYRANGLGQGVRFRDNLVWTRGGPARVYPGPSFPPIDTWEAWLAMGLDEGSRVAEPGFVDPAADDYRLAEDSPAWEMGFQAIEMDEIGCYELDRASWPIDPDAGVVREQPILYTQPVLPVAEDFEIDLPGRPPRHGDVAVDGAATIVVTDALAATGQHSLQITDAPDLRNVWLPRIYYPLDHQEGRVRISLALRLDGRRSPALYLDPRQYSDTGEREYLSGPMLQVAADGSLSAGGRTLATLPMDRWVTLDMTLTLGAGAPQSTELTVTAEGAEPQQVTVLHVSPDFSRLERLVIASIADADAVFWLDDIAIAAVGE